MDASGTPRLRDLAPALSPAALTSATVKLLLVAFVAMPVAAVLLTTATTPPWRSGGGVLVLVYAPMLLWLLMSREIDDDRAKRIVGVCVLAFVAVQLFTLFNHVTDPWSDFETQWRTAVHYATDGVSQPDRPQAQRALPVLYPLAVLFGDHALAYQLTNLVLSTATMVMATWIARRWWGWEGAAKAAILLALAVEVYFAKNIPSHDLLGTFGLVSFLTVWVEVDARLPRISRPFAVAVATGVVAGVAVAWTDWQRSLGVFALAALGAFGVIELARRARMWAPRAVFAAVAFATALGAGALLRHAELVAAIPPTNITSTEMNLASYASYDSDGRSLTKVERHPLLAALGDDRVSRVGPAIAIQALLGSPVRKYGNFLGRCEHLLDLGRRRTWYFDGAHSHRLVPIGALSLSYREVRVPVVTALLVLLLIACGRVVRGSQRELDVRAMPLVLIGSFVCVMGLAGESQSRYSQFVFTLVPMYAGLARPLSPLAAWRSRRALVARATRWHPPIGATLARAAISCVVVVMLTVAALMLGRARTPALVDFGDARVEVHTTGSYRSDDGVTTGQNMVILDTGLLTQRRATVRITSSIDSAESSALTFALDSIGSLADPARLDVLVDGEPALGIRIVADTPARAYDVPLGAGGRHTVTFLYAPAGKPDPANHHRLRIGYAGLY